MLLEFTKNPLGKCFIFTVYRQSYRYVGFNMFVPHVDVLISVPAIKNIHHFKLGIKLTSSKNKYFIRPDSEVSDQCLM